MPIGDFRIANCPDCVVAIAASSLSFREACLTEFRRLGTVLGTTTMAGRKGGDFKGAPVRGRDRFEAR